METNPYQEPGTPDSDLALTATGSAWRWGVRVLVLVGVVGFLLVLLAPVRRTAPLAARKTQCSSQLKNIALALHSYELTYGALPPAYTVDQDGNPLHSWRTLLLPYLGQKALYDQIDLSKPWDDPVNQVAREAPTIYRCPSVANPATHTLYLAVVAERSCLRPGTPRRLAEVTDAPERTLVIVEVDADHGVHWMSPQDATEATILKVAAGNRTPHTGVVLAAWVDGSVFSIPTQTLSAARFRAMVTIDGGDDDLAAKDR